MLACRAVSKLKEIKFHLMILSSIPWLIHEIYRNETIVKR